jgi:hypothetical protein
MSSAPKLQNLFILSYLSLFKLPLQLPSCEFFIVRASPTDHDEIICRISAMFNLIFSQMYRTNQPLLGYVEIAFNQVLPKVYAISMMYTLNARRAIRSRVSGSCNGSSSDRRVQPRHTNVGSFLYIQLRTIKHDNF